MTKRIERIVDQSSFGTKSVQAARASVSPNRAARIVARATAPRPEENSEPRDTK